MRKFYIALTFIFYSLIAQAHPGIGIVYDGKQTIYYTDLNHVWKLNTQTGVSEIFIKDIHTHELFLDSNGNLYGEHYWYIEAEEKFKNYIWRVDKNGTLEKIRNDLYGENHDFSFIRDKAFNSYDIKKEKEFYNILKKDSLNKEYILHSVSLKHPTWKYLTTNNDLLFIDFPSVYSANKDSVTVLVQDISSKRFPFSTQSDDHNIYGIWTDLNNDIYVAIYGGREVKKIYKNGETERVLKSSFLWSPVNGIFDKNGNLWVLECKIGGDIRVRKVNKTELTNKASFLFENSIFIAIITILALFVYRKIKGKKSITSSKY